MDEWWEDDRERPEPVRVPHTELSPQALRGVIEACVRFDPLDSSVTIVPARG
jgi:hypothetical protein